MCIFIFRQYQYYYFSLHRLLFCSLTSLVWLQGEPNFHLFGFIRCIGATAARALKSVLQGILLSSDGEKLNSMNLLLYMAPVAVVILLPAALLIEDNVVGITIALARKDVNVVWYLLFNSPMAYRVNLSNFLVTKHTSALSL
ncbi:putative sugar phosphate transporter domain-containing protein [Helianthus debilis subsp. tardiflorus]